MNALPVLMGLLLLAYVGSFLVSGRAIRGFGLPSGAEYVVLGFIVGPHVLRVIGDSILESLDPIAQIALGWLALVIGLDFAIHEGRRVRARRILGGVVVALVTGGFVGGIVYFAAPSLMTVTVTERILLAGGVGAACAETTRHALRWVVERHKASGPLVELLAELADCDDLVPILGLAFLFALVPVAKLPFSITAWEWAAVTLGFGAALGLMAAVLLGRDFRHDESWGVLLGLAVLGTGIAARLGLSSISAMFAMGVTISLASTHRAAVRELVGPSERPVLHPMLVLAGAHLDLRATTVLPIIVLLAIAARMTAKGAVGFALRLSPTARAAGPLLGMGLVSSGALAMTVGLAFALRFPGAIGDTVLATAAAITVFGEFVGPASLKIALKRAGEVRDDVAREGATS